MIYEPSGSQGLLWHIILERKVKMDQVGMNIVLLQNNVKMKQTGSKIQMIK
jgi:hypothetical protein